jgi:hypothetical protein
MCPYLSYRQYCLYKSKFTVLSILPLDVNIYPLSTFPYKSISVELSVLPLDVNTFYTGNIAFIKSARIVVLSVLSLCDQYLSITRIF